MDRGYLGAAKLSGAYEPDGKISAEFLNETPSALLLMTTRRPFTPPATVTSASRTAKLVTSPYCQVDCAMAYLASPKECCLD